MTNKLLVVFLITVLVNGSCKKQNSINSALPYPTQTGQNTLGFYLNGEKWIPQGNNGTPNLKFNYDKNFDGGVFNISAYRTLPNNGRQYLIMYGNPFQSSEKLVLPNSKFGMSYSDNHGCSFDISDTLVKLVSGNFAITKLDQVNHIFSAQFEMNLTKTGCDAIHITEGRCDFSF